MGTRMSAEKTRLGIMVGGGPAPGINSAISACAIVAIINSRLGQWPEPAR